MSVIGYVLVIGFVLSIAMGVVLIGASTLDDVKTQAKSDQAELAFTQVDAKMARVALGDSGVQTVTLGINQGDGSTVVMKYEGTMTLREKDGPVLFRHRLGSLEYHNDGTTIAYQGGGVWRGTGRNAVMVSPPEVHYREGTLTIPLVVAAPGESTIGDQVTVSDRSKAFGLGPGVVENRVVILEIESAYYSAWAEYFRTRIDRSVVHVDHANTQVTVELGRPELMAEFTEAGFAMGIPSGETGVLLGTGSATIDGPVKSTGTTETSPGAAGGYSESPEENVQSTLTPLDSIIDAKVNAAPVDPDVEAVDIGDNATTLQDGTTYYDNDGFTLGSGDDVDVNLGDGNVTLVVNGDVNLHSGSLTVDPAGTDHVLRVFVTGDLSLDGTGTVDVTEPSVDAKHVQMFGRSTTQVAVVNGAYFEGVIYAPRESEITGQNTATTTAANMCSLNGPSGGAPYADFCVATGSAEIDGALIGAPIRIAQASALNYDENLADVAPALDEEELAPPLTYLHVSANQVTVDGVPTTGPEALETPTASLSSVSVTETGSNDHEITVDWTASGEQLDTITVTVIDALGETEVQTISAGADSESGSTTVTISDPVATEYRVLVAATNAEEDTSSTARVASCSGCGSDDGDDGDDGDSGPPWAGLPGKP